VTSYFPSHNFTEVVQIGRVPVYLYDDVPWLPYEGTNISLSTFGYSGRMGNLMQLAKQLKSVDEKEYQEKLRRVKEVRTHYTYKGLIQQLEKFFSNPLGSSGGDLRCTRVPDKDHRRLIEPDGAAGSNGSFVENNSNSNSDSNSSEDSESDYLSST
jgi:hypothetical protein